MAEEIDVSVSPNLPENSATIQDRDTRLSICDGCDRYSSLHICSECNCWIPLKSWWNGATCPLGKW